MRWSQWPRPSFRMLRFEECESRMLLSVQTLDQIQPDYFVEAASFETTLQGLDDAHLATGLTEARAEYGFDGAGQTVVAIDSGVAWDHVALGGGLGTSYRVVGGFDFTEERDTDPYDDGPYGAHGTHVAGIIGGDDGLHTGVAPGVDLVALRVFNDSGQGYFHWVEEALAWVHDHRFDFENPITAVNLSLGSDFNGQSVPGWATLEDELAQLHADGIFVAVAAGNAFQTYNEPGLSYPAVSPYVVPVASVDADGSLSYFSQRDQRVIAAPGRSIQSSVPDYLGNGNGIADDYARFSGTSMASPYVAGASVLVREAMQFAGIQNITTQSIYDWMIQTADTVHDAVTGASYSRLNLGRAIDAIMPADDYGSSQIAAYDLGSIADTRSLSGTIGRLDDVDWFRFTATAAGTLSVALDSADEWTPQWVLPGGQSLTGDDGFSFEVVAGQSYSFGLGTGSTLAHYSLDLDLDATPQAAPGADFGRVAQAAFEGYQVDTDGQWFTVTAANDGILTLEALFAHGRGDVDLQLYDAAGQLLATSYSTTDNERIDLTATAGQTYRLRAYTYGGGTSGNIDFHVTNLVSQQAGQLRVLGTEGNDVFTFRAGGSTHQVSINGVEYQVDAASVSRVTFDGLGGTDAITLTGTAGNDTAVVRPGSAQLSGAGYRAEAQNVETIRVLGGGGYDSVTFHDSNGDDAFVARVGQAELTGEGFALYAEQFENARALATAGGNDTARLYDSAGNDVLVAGPVFARLAGSGFSSQAEHFDSVLAYAERGVDVAKLYDSAGNDLFEAGPTSGTLSGNGFLVRASGFDGVHAYATAGGHDTARLYDSVGNDTLAADATATALYGPGFYNRAKFFEQVNVHRFAGGSDQGFAFSVAEESRTPDTETAAAVFSQAMADWLYGFEQTQLRAALEASHDDELAAVDLVLLDGEWG